MSINISSEIRDLVASDKTITGSQVMERLQKKFPGMQLNRASVQVAFSVARKKLGIGREAAPKKSAAPRRVARQQSNTHAAVTNSGGSQFEALQSAKALLSLCGGDVERAQNAVVQIAQLQLP